MDGNISWSEAAKWVIIMVSAGVVTGLALYYVTGTLQNQAVMAARAEFEKLLLAGNQPQTQSQNQTEIAESTVQML